MIQLRWVALLGMMLTMTLTASATDISGAWKGTAQTPAGTTERTFNFKVDGNKLTGDTTSDMFGKSTIEDGKIDGDTVTFTLTIEVQGNEGKVNYTGKIKSDDEIDFHVEIPAFDQKVDYVAKRVK